jgi:hypothetical protein
MISNRDLTRAVGAFHREHGYAAGMPKETGFVQGAKTFPPFELHVTDTGLITVVDTYFGSRESGGLAVVSLGSSPILLIQYHGGEPPWVPDEDVDEINAFLKRALRGSRGARLPNQMRRPYVFFEEVKYGYAAFAIGDIWNLQWVEVIYRKDWKHDVEHLTEGDEAIRLFENILLHGLVPGVPNWIVFYHVVTHQRIR